MLISWWTKRIFLGWRHAVYFPQSSWNVVLLTVSTAEAVGHCQNTGFISTALSVRDPGSSSYNPYHITNPLAPSSGQFWYDSFHTVDFVHHHDHISKSVVVHTDKRSTYLNGMNNIWLFCLNKCCIFHHHAFIHSLTCWSTFSGKSLFRSSFVSIVFIVYVEKLT